ncbi:Pescadillo-like protein, partial [Cucurbita argyrosperma subsp. sororia]
MHLVEDAAGKDDVEDENTRVCKNLFKNMKFFLSRSSRITAFGGMVCWEGDGAPFEESDETITYQIVDRPTQTHKFLSRDYVQPQWVFDCVNTRIILPTDGYLVGSVVSCFWFALRPKLIGDIVNEAEDTVS